MRKSYDLGYSIGILDSKAQIRYYSQGSTRKKRLEIAVTTLSEDIANHLEEAFGGTITKHKNSSYVWRLTSRQARKLLIEIEEYLVANKEMAMIALKLKNENL